MTTARPGRQKGKRKPKTTAKSTNLVGKNPAFPNLNAGGTPGNAGGGRISIDEVITCRNLVNSPETQASVVKILKDDTHQHFSSVFRFIYERAYGKTKETVELTGKDGEPLKLGAIIWGAEKIPL